jgi:hypothetical protein
VHAIWIEFGSMLRLAPKGGQCTFIEELGESRKKDLQNL